MGRCIVLAVVSENMRQVGAYQKYITSFKSSDKITNDNLAFAAQDLCKLAFRMLVQMIIKMTFMIFLKAKRFLRRFRNFEWQNLHMRVLIQY